MVCGARGRVYLGAIDTWHHSVVIIFIVKGVYLDVDGYLVDS